MYWKEPHVSKIYEALTAIADGDRIELVEENKVRCYSSSRGKFYEIEFDPNTDQIMSNDNSAYYTDSLSYPMIALLMLKGRIKYNEQLLSALKGIRWKDINQKFKNNYDEAIEFVLKNLKSRGEDVDFIKEEINKIYKFVCELKLGYLGAKRFPPKGY